MIDEQSRGYSCPPRPFHRKRIAASLPKEDECRIWTVFNDKNIHNWLVLNLLADQYKIMSRSHKKVSSSQVSFIIDLGASKRRRVIRL